MSNYLSHRTIAERYAKAFFMEAASDDANKIASDLEKLRLLIELKEFKDFLNNPLLSQEKQKSIIADISGECGFSKIIISFLNIVSENNRMSLLPYIFDAIIAMQKKFRGEIDINVTSAYHLSEIELEKIGSIYNNAGKVNIHNIVDEEIIGGLMIRIGSLMIDDSIRNKLDRFEINAKSSIN